jgi:hypothetical protein
MPKPSTSAIVNTSNSLTANLAAAFLLNEGSGTTTKDYVSGSLSLTLAGGIAWSLNGLTASAVNHRASATTPAGLKLSLPITIYLRLIPASGNPTVNASYFGVAYNSTETTPFVGYNLDASGNTTPAYRGDGNSAGTFKQTIQTTQQPNLDAGTAIDLAFVMTAGGGTLYRNGTSIATIAGPFSNPTYDATSIMGFGDIVPLGRNSKAEFVFGYIFSDDMSASLATIQADPYALFRDATASAVLDAFGNVVSASGYPLDAFGNPLLPGRAFG